MRTHDVNKIQKQAFAEIVRIADEHGINISVEQLSNVSSIVLEHLLEASAGAEPDRFTCPFCTNGGCVTETQQTGHNRYECSTCEVSWIKMKPPNDKMRGPDCPQCQGSETILASERRAKCRTCENEWAV